MRRLAASILVAGLALPNLADAWGTHYLVTDRALDRPELTLGQTKVAVEQLETFLASDSGGLQKLFADYDAWEAPRHPYTAIPYDPGSHDVLNFLHAAHLNPNAHIAYVNRILPGQPAPAVPVAAADVSPWIHDSPFIVESFASTPPDTQTTARDILVTYCDEPDWGIDHELWTITQYGYGPEPYGKPTGESSKAAFHMFFAHENGLVRKFAAEVTHGETLDRIELSSRLAKLAFETGHPYWGYRFSAWALHYAQDLGQPYHSRAIPSAGTMYYIGYILSPAKAHMKAKRTQLELNRHFAYEDYVSYALQDGYSNTEQGRVDLAKSLAKGDLVYPGVTDDAGVVEHVGAAAANHAKAIDKAIVKAFGPKITEDWHYQVDTDPSYSLAAALKTMPPDAAKALLAETETDFANTGEATRTMLHVIGAIP